MDETTKSISKMNCCTDFILPEQVITTLVSQTVYQDVRDDYEVYYFKFFDMVDGFPARGK